MNIKDEEQRRINEEDVLIPRGTLVCGVGKWGGGPIIFIGRLITNLTSKDQSPVFCGLTTDGIKTCHVLYLPKFPGSFIFRMSVLVGGIGTMAALKYLIWG